MGKLLLELLSRSEIEKVHAQSLRVLEQVGVQVLDAECRQALARAGARVDGGDRVYLPAGMVREALGQAPSVIEFCASDGTRTQVGGDHRCYSSIVTDPWIMDYETGRPRRPVLNDIVRHTRLSDALPNVRAVHRMDMPPADVPAETAYVRSLEAFVTNTTKHLMALPASDESTRDWLEVAEILAGGRRLAELPLLTFGVAVTSPLMFTAVNANVLRAAVRNGLTTLMVDCTMAGMTGPLTFAGSLLLANAENLFLATLTQVLAPGAGFIYGAGQSLTDLRTGFDVYYNGDKMLWKTANVQMGKFYNLPITGESAGSLGGRYDIQTGIEEALLMLPSVAGGQNLFGGLGSCYNACGMSAEFIVIQSDLATLLERISAGIDTSDEMLAFDSIAAAGPGGHFLEDPLTIRMLRSGEFYTAGCFDRTGERSPNAPEDAMLAKAHARVEELLRTHTPAVPQRTVDDIARWAERKTASVVQRQPAPATHD